MPVSTSSAMYECGPQLSRPVRNSKYVENVFSPRPKSGLVSSAGGRSS